MAELGPSQPAQDRLDIEDLPRRYAHGIDERNWARVDSCFAEDAQVTGQQHRGPYPEYIAQLRRSVETFRTTMHFVGNQIVDLHGDSGDMRTYGIAYHLGNTHPDGDFVVGVHYVDHVVRREDRWLIHKRSVFGIWRQALSGVQVLPGHPV